MNQMPAAMQHLAAVFAPLDPGGPGGILQAQAKASAQVESVERMRPNNVLGLNAADGLTATYAPGDTVTTEVITLPLGFLWGTISCAAADEPNFVVTSFSIGSLPFVLQGFQAVPLSVFCQFMNHIDRITPYVLSETTQGVQVQAILKCVYDVGPAVTSGKVHFRGFAISGNADEFICTMAKRTQETNLHSTGFTKVRTQLHEALKFFGGAGIRGALGPTGQQAPAGYNSKPLY